ncbi:MAG TPA: helix-turn-helix domain-containing protein [Steroidobacteraceae bacterium]
MNRLETLSTDAVQPSKRVEYWNDVACDALTAQCAQPTSPATFWGRMTRGDIGGLRFVEFSSDAAVVRRSRAHIACSREANYLIRIQLSNESLSSQCGQDVLLRPGDFTLCDSIRPYKLTFTGKVSILTVRVSKELLQRYIGCPDSLVHIPVSGSTGGGALASKLIREIWHSSDGIVADTEPRVAHVVLELFASAYIGIGAASIDSSCLASPVRLLIFDFIEQSLRDPELSPVTIAQSLRISPRHVHRVFAQRGESVTRYILRRRLERCRAALDDPLLAALSLSRICSGYGFKTLPHFSRLFREEYGVTPSDYRRGAHSGKFVSPG